jgi:hypothetical protein
LSGVFIQRHVDALRLSSDAVVPDDDGSSCLSDGGRPRLLVGTGMAGKAPSCCSSIEPEYAATRRRPLHEGGAGESITASIPGDAPIGWRQVMTNIIEVEPADAAALELELRGAGLAFTVAKEDRYFGNVDVVSIVLDVAKAVSVVLPPLLNWLSSRKKSKIVINGVEIRVSDPITDDDKERISQALKQ